MWLWDLPFIVAASCCIGMLGALFVTINTRLVYAVRRRFIQGHRFRQAQNYWAILFCARTCFKHVRANAWRVRMEAFTDDSYAVSVELGHLQRLIVM